LPEFSFASHYFADLCKFIFEVKKLKLAYVQNLLLAALMMLFIGGCAQNTGPVPQVTPTSAVLLPGNTLQFTGTEKFSAIGNAVPVQHQVWSVNNVTGGNSKVGTISSSGLYTAPTNSSVTSVQVSVVDSEKKVSSSPAQVTIFLPNNFTAGSVTTSKNPQVAQYTIAVPQGATVEVQFGSTTNYGLSTWAQPAPQNGGDVSLLVAGMRSSSTYHMRGMIHLPNGNTVFDKDQTFKTGSIDAKLLPNIQVQQTAGYEPAPGIEFLNLFEETVANPLTTVATDISGNVIWYYPIQPNQPFPARLLPNGHILLIDSGKLTAAGDATTGSIQEIDLAGNIINEITQDQLSQALAAFGAVVNSGSDLVANHDILELPNSHLIILASIDQTVNGQTVIGNEVIDWDPTMQAVVWAWNTFDHLSVSHAPFGLPDWTHGNALVYSSDDGNLLVSLRNQNWILKLNYQDGAGDGSILWKLGPGGDFTLPAGQDPIEWNYGQHYPVIVSPQTSGIFDLMFFNNGNNRLVDSAHDVCGTSGQIACYSSVPIFQINESDHTVQVLEERNLSPAYSICCGSVGILSNGDLEYDVALDLLRQDVSFIQESTRGSNPTVFWEMDITDQIAYRGFRIPSLYPGVTWTQADIATANAALPAGPEKKPVGSETKITAGPPFPYVP
jgi:arylsulfate sulfotransferase